MHPRMPMGISTPAAFIMSIEPAYTKACHIWLSPAFPVGSFAFSHGLEWAVESGRVADGQSLQAWLRDLLDHGGIATDCCLVTLSYDADQPMRLVLNDLALALTPSAERYLETNEQGRAFLRAVLGAWPATVLQEFAAQIRGGDVAYPVAVGTACKAHACDRETVLFLFVTAALQNLTSAALRLSLVGQTETQLILADLYPHVLALVDRLRTATLADLASAAWVSDICAMRHETQYSRLFRS